jgi:hypothetical protein
VNPQSLYSSLYQPIAALLQATACQLLRFPPASTPPSEIISKSYFLYCCEVCFLLMDSVLVDDEVSEYIYFTVFAAIDDAWVYFGSK